MSMVHGDWEQKCGCQFLWSRGEIDTCYGELIKISTEEIRRINEGKPYKCPSRCLRCRGTGKEPTKLDLWSPIETAPKDGREVLLRVELRAGIPGKIFVGHWMPGGHCIEDHPPIDAGWYFWTGAMFNVAYDPTHWMELPK